MAIMIAAAKIHGVIHTSGIASEHLLDETDALEELTPVEGRNEAKAANEIRHRRLLTRLMPAFGANDILDAVTAGGEHRVELTAKGFGGRAVFTRPLQQADGECRVNVGRQDPG